MMSVRALNVNFLHKFSPVVNARKVENARVSTVPRATLLSRASDYIVNKVERQSKLRVSKLMAKEKPQSPVFKPGIEE